MIAQKIKKENVEKVRGLINDAHKIVITTHVSPDGDAMGSSLALADYLMGIGKYVKLLLPSAPPAFLRWLPHFSIVHIYSNESEKVEQLMNGADLIFSMDFNTPSRVDKLETCLRAASAPKVLIDHHLYPEDFCDVSISHSDQSSTCELLYRLFLDLGVNNQLSTECAVCLYTGMMTDTGAFTYNSNKPEIYEMIALLLKKGIDKDEIYARVHNNYSANRFILQGEMLSKHMKVYESYPVVLLVLNKELLDKYNYKQGDSEGFVNIPLSIKGVKMSLLMREDYDKVKISLRSTGEFPCNVVAQNCFNGGGHRNASGGEFYGTLEDAIKRLEEELPKLDYTK